MRTVCEWNQSEGKNLLGAEAWGQLGVNTNWPSSRNAPGESEKKKEDSKTMTD